MKSVRVHRINFFEPEPKAVRCLVYESKISRLALSRADSSIEIWDVFNIPFLEKVIPGSSDKSVETLAWCDGRLFSAGLHGCITEYDLNTLIPKYQISVTSCCPIWCMSFHAQKTCLALGNEDGHVVLHDLSPEGLDYQKKFDKQEGCILCLSWHKDGNIIVTGSMDTIRIWNVETGHVVNRIILSRSSKNVATIVWCIAITSDMTIISGDSCGKISFWEPNTCTLLSCVNAHKGDVLALCIDKDEDTIYASGVDPTIIMCMKSQSNGKWLKSVQRVVHTHDVRALQLVGDFLVSGGDDCSVIFTKYPPKTTIKFFPFCQMHYCTVAPYVSCLLLRYSSYLEVWKIGESSVSGAAHNPTNLLRIKARENESIICCSLSSNGKWLAYSSQYQIKLFSVKLTTDSSEKPSVHKVTVPEEVPSTTSVLLFSSEPTRLIFYAKNKLYILKCDNDVTKIISTIDEDAESASQTYLLELSGSNMYLACGSHNGSVLIYHLQSQKVCYRLPHYTYQPTAMQFDPSSENLIVVYSDRKVVEYNLKKQGYSEWTKQKLLIDFQASSFYPITSVVHSLNKLFLQDENSVYILDKSYQNLECGSKRQKTSEESEVACEESSLTTLTKYEHISSIHSYLKDIIVIEILSSKILDSLPPPAFKKKFGT